MDEATPGAPAPDGAAAGSPAAVEPGPASPEDAEPDVGAGVAPAVVAVVLAADPGPWFAEALAAVGAQDYPNLSVLVIDNGDKDVTPRVAAVLPHAYVRRLPAPMGIAAAYNEVLAVVEGASHFVFLHDDAAPDPTAIRLMVEEAFRSNAGVVTPKLVDWDHPEKILQAGMGADKSGAPALIVEPGELDQEQHDAVRDVFVAPGGCTLVRADLFSALGGFDPEMTRYEEDLDFSWRAQIAGARVIVAPAARVRHVEALSSGRRRRKRSDPAPDPRVLRDEARPLRLRHRLRAVLTCYSRWHLLRVLPQIAVLAGGEAIYGLVTGRRRTTRAIVDAWRWNGKRRRELRARRANVKQTRLLPDSEVRRLQARGSARMTAFVRGQLVLDDRHQTRLAAGLASTRDDFAGDDAADLRRSLAAAAAIVAVLLVGTRLLIGGRLPAVGQLLPFPDSPATLLRAYLSGWRSTGLGGDAPAPPAFAFLGLAGMVLLGAMGVLQKIVVLGMVPVGLVGMWRLARPVGHRARLTAVVVYAAIPLPYNALATGRWAGLIAYGATPWLLWPLLRAMHLPPFAPAPAEGATADPAGAPRWPRPPREPSQLRLAALGLGVGLAVVTAFVPSMPLVLVLAATGMALGSILAGDAVRAGRALLLAAAASAAAALLLFPWTLDFVLPGARWSAVAGVDVGPDRALNLARLLRFETGPLGAAPLGWAFVLAAVLPLAVGRGWRFAWAARLWAMAVLLWVVAWVAGRAAVGMPAPEVLLAPVGVAVALAIALGLAAFEIDLPGYRFGWRQAASAAAAGAVALGVLPVLAGAANGRWHAPTRDFRSALGWMPAQRSAGDFRVLWLGDPGAVPGEGWRLSEGVEYATSRRGTPTLVDLWPGASEGAADLTASAVRLARQGSTTALGHLLAPMAVRYVVVPDAASAGPTARALRAPADLRAALAAQVDLRQIEAEPALTVYENAAWGPLRARVDDAAADALRQAGLVNSRKADLAGARPVLPGIHGATRFTGELAPGYVYLAEAASPRWSLHVAGHGATHVRAGWANLFAVDDAGAATLRYSTSPARYVALAIEIGFWTFALRQLVRGRRRARRRA